VYGAIDFRAWKRYSLSLAAREEVYRGLSGEFSPTVAGGAWLTSRLKLRASASRAFRVPGYTDLFYHDPANLGSPGLRAERAWTYETGLDWHAGDRLRGDVTVFHRRERDGIDYARASPNDIWRALNIQNLRFTGVEASLRLVRRRVHTIDVRCTGLRGTQDTIAAAFTKYVFNFPVHSAVLAWQGSSRGFLFRSRLGVLERKARDPYAIWDAYAAFSRGRLRPFVQLSNITSTAYQEIPGVAMPGRGIVAGLEVVLYHP
jgi:iron complex outermembrane receptor protein